LRDISADLNHSSKKLLKIISIYKSDIYLVELNDSIKDKEEIGVTKIKIINIMTRYEYQRIYLTQI
jgi:hypothetical protein